MYAIEADHTLIHWINLLAPEASRAAPRQLASLESPRKVRLSLCTDRYDNAEFFAAIGEVEKMNLARRFPGQIDQVGNAVHHSHRAQDTQLGLYVVVSNHLAPLEEIVFFALRVLCIPGLFISFGIPESSEIRIPG